MNGKQGRIQDFLGEGAPIPEGGTPTYYFCRKLHENEGIGSGGIPGAPPGSATEKGVNVMTLEKLYAVVLLTPDEPFRRFDGRIESRVASDPFLF